MGYQYIPLQAPRAYGVPHTSTTSVQILGSAVGRAWGLTETNTSDIQATNDEPLPFLR